MIAVTGEFKKYVLDVIKNYRDLYHPVKSPYLVRVFKKYLNIKQIVPNPDDEFCSPEIGPDYGIVSDYEKRIRNAYILELNPLMENLVVEKINTGDYMILNGHHRWLASHRIGLKKVPVEIVNSISLSGIMETLSASVNSGCISFNLDTVLLTDGSVIPKDRHFFFPVSHMFRKGLRKYSPALIQELKMLGYDIWILTSENYSESYLRKLFELHEVCVDGFINCLAKRKEKNRFKDAFTDKYSRAVHIGSDSVIFVDTKTREYDIIEIDTDPGGWSSAVAGVVKSYSAGKGICNVSAKADARPAAKVASES